jgi:hypothetical protein
LSRIINYKESNLDSDSEKRILPIIKERQPDEELAPGLFQILKEIIRNENDYRCSFCNLEISEPKYKSIKDKKIVQFCEQECFDKFKF